MPVATACQKCGHSLDVSDLNGECPICLMRQVLSSVITLPSNPATGALTDRELDIDTKSSQPTGPRGSLRIPGYEILGELGRGGVGIVYLAQQVELDRVVALKMLLGESRASVEEEARFRAEAAAVARLQHANIVQIYDIGHHEGRLYIAFEFVDGGNLSQVLAVEQLSQFEAAQVLKLLAQATAYAHGMGIVHRDLKPANVLLTVHSSTACGESTVRERADSGNGSMTPHGRQIEKHSRIRSLLAHFCMSMKSFHSSPRTAGSTTLVPKIVDFGLAKRLDCDSNRTRSGTILGTPCYMAPEQAGEFSKGVGSAADIYSLGAILYEMLVGRPPFRAETILATLEQVRSLEPVAPRRLHPGIHRDLETICLKCLQKEPAKRYVSASELASDLTRFIAGEPIHARPVSKAERAWRWSKRRPALAGLLAAVGGLLVAVTVVPSALALRLNAIHKISERNAAEAKQNQHKAEDNARAAELARAEAVALAEQSQQRLARVRIATGELYANDDKHLSALLWYTQAWLSDKQSDRDDLNHRLRIASSISKVPPLVGLCIQSDSVRDANFDPGGNELLLRDSSDVAHLWDPFAGIERSRFAHGSNLTHTIFSPDGMQVVTCGGTSLKLWNREPLNMLLQCEHPEAVNWCDFHPGGSHLATACDDGRVRIWDLRVSAEEAVVRRALLPVTSTSTGKSAHSTMVTGSDSQLPDPGALPSLELVCDHAVRFVRFAPDGKSLLAADTSNHFSVWNFPDGKPLAKNQPLRLEYDAGQSLVACRPRFADQGRKLVTSGQRSIQVWDTSAWKLLKSYTLSIDVNDFEVSADGSRIIVTSPTALAVLLHTRGGEDATRFRLANPRQCKCAAISADGKLAATSSSGGGVSVWNADNGELLTTLRNAHALTRLQFRLGHDGNQQLMSTGEEGAVRIWELAATGISQKAYDFSSGLAHKSNWIESGKYRAIYSPSGELEFRAVGTVGKLHLRSTGQAIGEEIRHRGAIEHAIFSDDGRRLVTADQHACMVRDSGNGKAIGPAITRGSPFLFIQVSADGSRILTIGAPDKHACVWNADAGQSILTQAEQSAGGSRGSKALEIPGSEDHFLVRLSPDGRFVAMQRKSEQDAVVYRVNDGRQVFQTDLQKGAPNPIQFSADSRRCIVSNSDTRARVWDLCTGAAAGPFLRHPTFVRFANVNRDGTLAATFAADGKLRIWNAETGDLLITGELPLNRPQFWFTDDSKQLIVRFSTGPLVELTLPSFQIPAELAAPLVELLSCARIDETEGIAEVESDHFRLNPNLFLKAWRENRSGT